MTAREGMLEALSVIDPQHRWEDESLSAAIAAEFPSLRARVERGGDDAHVGASEWVSDSFDSWTFDGRIDELSRAPFTLRLLDDGGSREFPLHVLNRCQRAILRRNIHSEGMLFDRVLESHRALHDLAKPLVRADYNHALDVWQWLLRLDPDASAAVQMAAIFHDIERLASEADARVEHLADDYQRFKDAHAREGSAAAGAVLASAGVAADVIRRVTNLIANHEHRSDDEELALLNDADALSFFSLNSPGYADYFGPEQTRKKIAYTLGRMSDAARAKLASVYLRSDVRALYVREASCR